MMARSSAASRASGATRQALPRLAMVAALVIAATTMGASTAVAGKPGTTATQYSTIELAMGVDAAADGVGDAKLSRGDSVWFNTNIVGLSGREYPLVSVECTADGTSVWLNLDTPDATVVLGSGSSTWSRIEPAPDATCVARLWAYGKKVNGIWVTRELTDPSEPPLSFTTDG